MIDSFGIYYEDENDFGLVAAGSQWTSGGNSAMARRARVAMQRRDRYGRWAEMGGGISFPGRLPNGQVKKLIGRYVGPSERPDYMRVLVTQDGFGYQAGIYEVPSKVATASKAILTGETLKEAGVKLDVNGKSIGDVLDRDIEFTAGMFKGKPSALDQQMADGKVSTLEKKRIVKARLKAPAHKSYNVVDANGKRIDKDPDAPKPEPKARGEKFPLPTLPEVESGDDEKTAKKKRKERARREWWVDENGKRLKDEKVTDEIKADPSRHRIRDVENHRVLDGNGYEIKFKPEMGDSLSPLPKDKGGEQPRENEDGFWNINEVSEDEVVKDLTDPQEVYEIMYDGGFVEVSPEVALEAVRIAQEDFKFLGKVPDDQIHFKNNPTDPIFKEIADALQDLPPRQSYRLRRALNLGIMSKDQLDELKSFLDNAPRGEDGSLDSKDMAALHRRFRNMGVDITNMRLKGMKYFSNDNLGAERINMPQLDADEQADFLAYAESLGIKITAGSKRPGDLHPVQAEMDMGDVGNLMASWLDPEARAKWGMDDGVLFVTRDGYVLDGHHRWSSALLAELAGAGAINLKVQVIDLDHEDALKLVNAWNDHVGIGRIAVGGKNVAEPRPVKGQIGRAQATLPEPSKPEAVTKLTPGEMPVISEQPTQFRIPSIQDLVGGDSEPVMRGEVRNGKMNVGLHWEERRDIRPVTSNPKKGAVLRSFPAENFGGDYNPGYYWDNGDGTVAKYSVQRDGARHRNATPPAWREPDNSGVVYRPGDKFDPAKTPELPEGAAETEESPFLSPEPNQGNGTWVDNPVGDQRIPRAYRAPGSSNRIPTNERELKEFLDREVSSKEDLIDESLLTPDKTERGLGVDNRNIVHPGGKTVFKNLKRNRAAIIEQLKELALDGETEKFNQQFAMLKRITSLINQMHDNQVAGQDALRNLENRSSTKNLDAKMGTFEILPNSIVTEVGTMGPAKGKTIITNLQAVSIGKDGNPYLFVARYSASGRGGGVSVYELKPDGSAGTNAGNLTLDTSPYGDYTGYREYGVPGEPQPGVVHGMFIEPEYHAVGLASGCIFLSRWASERAGYRFTHSGTLYPPGNFYSKTVSEFRDNARSQADKNAHVHNPNGDIFKAMKAAGLVDGEYKPYDPANPESWGNGWLKRLIVAKKNNGGGGDNRSRLDSMSYAVHEALAGARNWYQQNKENPSAQEVVSQLPEIFRDHITGEKDNWDKWDIQYNLLDTIYEDGPSKEDSLKMIDDIIAGVDALRQLGTSPAGEQRFTVSRLDSVRLNALRTAIEATEFKPENRIKRPQKFNPNAFRVVQSPFAGYHKFSDWKVPAGVKRIENELPFSPRPKDAVSDPDGWTENPTDLASMFDGDTLAIALKQAIVDNKGGNAKLPFRGGEGEVSPNAIFKALEEKGEDATKFIANVYDEMNGNQENNDKLADVRSRQFDIASVMNSYRRQLGELDRPVEFSNIGGNFDSENNRIISDSVKRDEIDPDGIINLQPLSPDNKGWFFAGGDSAINASPYSPRVRGRDWLVNGVADSPKIIARNFNTQSLVDGLDYALKNRRTNVTLQFPNDVTHQVSVNAIRDALQHQGFDVNSFLSTHPNLVEQPGKFRIVGQEISETTPDGGKVTTRYLSMNVEGQDYRDGQAIAKQQLIRDANNEVIGYRLSRYANKADALSGQNASDLVVVKRNADGKFEIWTARPEDGVSNLGEDGSPVAIYSRQGAVFHDIGEYIKRVNNISGRGEVLDSLASASQARNEREDSPVVKANSWDRVGGWDNGEEDFGGLLVAQPADDISTRDIYRGGKLLTADGISGVDTVTILDRGDTDTIEQYRVVTRDTNIVGHTVTAVDIDGERMFRVTGHEMKSRVFATQDEAVAYARTHSVYTSKLPAGGLQDMPAESFRQPDPEKGVVIGNPSITKSPSQVVKKTRVKREDGEVLDVEVTVQKGANPSWNAADGSGRNYVHTFVKVSRPGADDDEAPIASFAVKRTRNQQWSIVATVPGNSSDTVRNITTIYGDFDTKTEAFNALKSRIDNYLKVKDADTFPNVPLVDQPQARRDRERAAAEEARVAQERAAEKERVRLEREAQRQQNGGATPAGLTIPRDNDIITDEQFEEFLRRRTEIIDIPASAIRPWTGGGNAGESQLVVLPDGRKFKMKDSTRSRDGDARRRAYGRRMGEPEVGVRNEVAVHALYELSNSPATIAGFGRLEDGTIVLLDEFVPGKTPVSAGQVMDNKYTDPQYAQAVQDVRDAVLINMLLGHHDYFNNGSNFMVVDTPNGPRGLIADGGGAGIVDAWSTGSNGMFEDSPTSMMNAIKTRFGDFMATGIVNNGATAGKHHRGMSKEDIIESARKHILPLTKERVRAVAEAHFTNPDLVNRFVNTIETRRAAVLNYLGIDPNEVRVPQDVAPAGRDAGLEARTLDSLLNPPDGYVPSVERDGYALPHQIEGANFPQFDERGRPLVELPVENRTHLGLNVLRTGNNIPPVPEALMRAIREGKVALAVRPFVERTHDERDRQTPLPLVVDREGNRHIGRWGARMTLARKRMADGTYRYLVWKYRSNSPMGEKYGDIIGDRYAPAMLPNTQLADHSLVTGHANLTRQLGQEVNPIKTTKRYIDAGDNSVVGANGVDIVDIDNADSIDLSQNANIKDARWVTADEIAGMRDNGEFVESINNGDFVGFLKESEEGNSTPVTNNNPGDGAGEDPNGGTTHPVREWGNNGFAMKTYQNGRHDDPRVIAEISRPGHGVVGEIRKAYHGHFIASVFPNGGNDKKVKAIFKSETDAKNWLATNVQRELQPQGDQINIFTQVPLFLNEYEKNTTPLFSVSRGYLNPTTDEQRRLANRLIDTKQTTPENRALFRAILAEQDLSNGEVGWVIGQLIHSEDRDAAEIQNSREQRDANNANNAPVNGSSAENAGNQSNGEGIVNAGNLRAGQKILGNINAEVAFVAPGENDTVNIGLVDANGKLSIFRVNRNSPLPVDARQGANPPAVVNNPVVARNRQQVFAIQNAIRQAYPGAHELPNGDFVVAQRDYRQADGTVFRYEAMVTKLDSDEFVSYVREQKLDANGNPAGEAKVAYLAEPGHSPRAVLNRLNRQAMSIVNSPVPANGFRQRGDIQREAVHPGHGQLVPESLVANRDAQYIGDTGIESTGHATKDALIGYINNLMLRGQIAPDIIEKLMQGNQNLFTRTQLDDIIERLDANRMYPGVNIIPYVSHNKVIARVGDTIHHVDADGNIIKTGKVTGRRPITVNRKPNGEYVYTDQLYAKWEGLPGNRRQVAARRVIVVRRADGAEPTPAVLSPNTNAPANNPVIPEMPNAGVNNPPAQQLSPEEIASKHANNKSLMMRFAFDSPPVINGHVPTRLESPRTGDWLSWGSTPEHPAWAQLVADEQTGKIKAVTWSGNDYLEAERSGNVNITFHDDIPSAMERINAHLSDGGQNSTPSTPSGLDEFDGADGQRYIVDRGQTMTRFAPNGGAMSDVSVQFVDGAWKVGKTNPDGSFRVLATYGDRGAAEAEAQRIIQSPVANDVDLAQRIENNYTALDDYINYSAVDARNHTLEVLTDSDSGKRFAKWESSDDSDKKMAHMWVDPRNGNIVATTWGSKNLDSTKTSKSFAPAGADAESIRQAMVDAEDHIHAFLDNSGGGDGGNNPPPPPGGQAQAPAGGNEYQLNKSENMTLFQKRDGSLASYSVIRDPQNGNWQVANNGLPISEETRYATREEAEQAALGMINGNVAQNPQAPESPQSGDNASSALPDGFRFSVDGDDIFTADGGNDNMYAVGERGTDGQWSVRVHANPRDALRNQNALAKSTHATKEEAKSAVAREIADRLSPPEPSQPILQWQDGSDGKSYLGLDGVPGFDADNSPVWGLSRMPFGAGWFVGAWNKKSDKDAGLPPAGTSSIADEAEARKFITDSRQAYIDRNPPQA